MGALGRTSDQGMRLFDMEPSHQSRWTDYGPVKISCVIKAHRLKRTLRDPSDMLRTSIVISLSFEKNVIQISRHIGGFSSV